MMRAALFALCCGAWAVVLIRLSQPLTCSDPGPGIPPAPVFIPAPAPLPSTPSNGLGVGP